MYFRKKENSFLMILLLQNMDMSALVSYLVHIHLISAPNESGHGHKYNPFLALLAGSKPVFKEIPKA